MTPITEIPYKENELLSAHTTFRVGGPADCLVDISSVAELQAVLAFIHRYGISHVVIGNGSNLLVRDGGIRGIVIRMEEGTYEEIGKCDGRILYRADAGVLFSSFAY